MDEDAAREDQIRLAAIKKLMERLEKEFTGMSAGEFSEWLTNEEEDFWNWRLRQAEEKKRET